MSCPWTQQEILDKIDYYTSLVEKIAKSQEYSVEGISIKRSDLKTAEESIDKWVERLEKYYPDSCTETSRAHFNEIGFISG